MRALLDKWRRTKMEVSAAADWFCELDPKLVGGCDVPEEDWEGGSEWSEKLPELGAAWVKKVADGSEVFEGPCGHRYPTLDLARKAAAAYNDPASLVGQCIDVWWPRERTWYEADVVDFNAETAKHIMVYREDLMRLEERLLQDDADGPKKGDPIVSWIVSGGFRELKIKRPTLNRMKLSELTQEERCAHKFQRFRRQWRRAGGDPSLLDGWTVVEHVRGAMGGQVHGQSSPWYYGTFNRRRASYLKKFDKNDLRSVNAVVQTFQKLGMMGPMRTGNKRAVDFSADAVAHNQDDHDSDNEPLNERSDRVDATRAAAKKAVEAARQAAKAEGLELRKGAKGYEGVYRTQQGAFQAIWRQEGVLDKHLGYGTVAEEAALLVARERKHRSTAGAAGAPSSGEAGASSSSSPGASSSGAPGSLSRASAALAAAEAEGLTLETNETSQSGYKYVLVDNAAGGNGKAAARYRVNVTGVLVQGGFGTPEEAALELARARRSADARAAAEAVAVNEQRTLYNFELARAAGIELEAPRAGEQNAADRTGVTAVNVRPQAAAALARTWRRTGGRRR